ncbi:protein yippee-like protein [Camelus ferus]|nr:protein yippee-like protein [Camelus ferus]
MVDTVSRPGRTREAPGMWTWASFQGSQGRAYLFNSVVNVGCGPAEERVLLTGLHAVADIYCENCKTTLGWKYQMASSSNTCNHPLYLEPQEGAPLPTTSLPCTGCVMTLSETDSVLKPLSFSKEHAFESSQKYKEGKFIIELAHMIKDNGWE